LRRGAGVHRSNLRQAPGSGVDRVTRLGFSLIARRPCFRANSVLRSATPIFVSRGPEQRPKPASPQRREPMIVRRLAKAALLGASLMALGGGASLAATKQHPPARSEASMVEPGAVAALTRMSAFLRANPTFTVKLETQRDEVDAYGQLLTFDGATTYKVKAPDGMDIETSDGDERRQYIYDGHSVTVFDPKTGFYGHFSAPPTIRQTIREAEDKYGIWIPLTDLFRWGEDPDEANDLSAAHYVGDATVNGAPAKQYAFRQGDVDWQIWIASGDRPLPLRVVLVARDDPARPQFEADLSWDTAPQFAADTFVFKPPPEAKAIPLAAAGR
jgi:hypothetical protein